LPACVLTAGGSSGSIEKELSALFETGGFRVDEGPCGYDAANLYDRINGAAPAYLAAGFESLTAFGLFDQATGTEIATEIFDMGRVRNAFGIYSLERDRSGAGKEFGGGSFRVDGALFFWQDRYYIKLSAYDIGPRVDDSLSCLAQLLSGRIPRSGGPPEEFEFFPGSDRLPGSERYIARDWLGQDCLSGVYTVDYASVRTEYTVALIVCANEKEAVLDFEELRSFAAAGKNDVTDLPEADPADAFFGMVSYHGPLVAARRNAYIFVVLGLEAPDALATLAPMIAQFDLH